MYIILCNMTFENCLQAWYCCWVVSEICVCQCLRWGCGSETVEERKCPRAQVLRPQSVLHYDVLYINIIYYVFYMYCCEVCVILAYVCLKINQINFQDVR